MIIFYDRILEELEYSIYSSLRSPCPTLHSALSQSLSRLGGVWAVSAVCGRWGLRLGACCGLGRCGEKSIVLYLVRWYRCSLIRCTSSLVRVDRRGRATCVPRRRSSTMTAPAAPRTSPTRATLNTAVPNTCPIYTCHYSSKPAHMTPSALGGSCAVQAAALSSRLSGYRERAIHLTCVTAPSSPVGSVAVEG